MIKYLKIFIIFSFTILSAQNLDDKYIAGKVNYISSQYIYISFANTIGINIGDTLYIKTSSSMIPKLIVKEKSSSSCAAILIKEKVKKDSEVFALIKNASYKINTDEKNDSTIIQDSKSEEFKPIKTVSSNYNKAKNKNFYGRFNISSYSNLSNNLSSDNSQNWRYTLSLNADSIGRSGFSFSNYITFKYKADEWNFVKTHLNNAAKIYDLALSYNFDKTKLILGRKINSKISNIGAIDGLQLESNFKSFYIGGVIGSRPNFEDYGYNLNLMQLGGYISKSDSFGNGEMNNTISVFQQMNNGTTDRRFLYLQHSNNIINKINFFLSSEIDLFKYLNDKPNNDFRLTSIYVSARYNPVRWISATASYDARKNVIYYETFKNYADQLIESALRQGFRLRLNVRPINNIMFSLNSGYRFSDNDIRPSKNYSASITHSNVPLLNLSANLNYLNLSTNYLTGNIIGIRISKDLFDGNVYADLSYRNVNYNFISSKSKLLQNILAADFSLRISSNLSLSLSFEGTFEGKSSYSNIFTNFSWRF